LAFFLVAYRRNHAYELFLAAGFNRNKISSLDIHAGCFSMKLVECVPNFSEGRRKEVIEAIVSEARSRNVKVLDTESDADHNRSVLTFVGTPEYVKDAAL